MSSAYFYKKDTVKALGIYEYLARDYEAQELENGFVMSVDVADTKLLGDLLFKRTLEIQINNDKWFSKDDEYYYMYSDQPIEEAKRKFEMAF